MDVRRWVIAGAAWAVGSGLFLQEVAHQLYGPGADLRVAALGVVVFVLGFVAQHIRLPARG